MKIIEFLKSLITARGLVNALIALSIGYFLKTLSDSLNAKSTIIKNCNDLKGLENVVDAISYASQLGRLDVVSLILALLGIVLGFGAIGGFMYIKEGSKLAAKQAAEDWLSEKGQATIYEYLNKNPDIIEKAINQRMDVELGKPKNLNDEESKELSDIKWEPESE